ncbi:MAG: hypothetical protein MI919_39080, partial [Holophagales bacterium]|nr:hypothetical protein [Holophagales bacterium]
GHGVDFTIPAGDNRWRTLVVDMTANPAWSDPAEGPITELRVDPIYDHPGQVIHLAWIRAELPGYRAPYEVDFTQGVEGWKRQNLSLPVQTSEGLRMVVQNDNPKFRSPPDLSIDGTVYDTLRVRLRIEDPTLIGPATGRMLFGTELNPTYTGARRFTYSLAATDDWQIITLDAGAHSAWGDAQEGLVTKLRLHPIESHPGRTVHIAEVWTDTAAVGPIDVDFSEGLQGWSATGIGPMTVTPEGLQLPIADSAPQLRSSLGLALDGTTDGTLALRLRVEGSPLTEPAAGKIFFKTAPSPTFDGHGVDFTIPAGDNRWRTLVVDMTANADWGDPTQGPITQLRVDPIYDHIGQTIHLARIHSEPPGYSAPYEVDFTQGTEGWKRVNLSAPVQTSEGIRMVVQNDNPKFRSPPDLSLDGTVYDTIQLRLRIEDGPLTEPASGWVLFGTELNPSYSGQRRFAYSIPAGDAWHTITIDAGAHGAWGSPLEGRITKLRIHPIRFHPGHTVHFAELRTESRAPVPQYADGPR